VTVRSPLPLAGGCAVAGLVIGAVVGLLNAPPYRATTTLLVKSHNVPVALPTVAALATSDAVAGNVANALGVSVGSVRSHLHVSTVPGTALVRVRYDAADRLHAQQVAQQEASALEAIAAARLPGVVTLTVVDPPTAERQSRPILAYALWGALIGAVVGLIAEWVRRFKREPREASRPVPGTDPVPGTEVAPPEPEPEPEPAPEPARLRESPLAELRRGLEQHRDEFSADQVAEWDAYLDAFEAHVVDGELPPSVAGMAQDVFEPLRDRLNRHEF
jgi:hypothetical protein